MSASRLEAVGLLRPPLESRMGHQIRLVVVELDLLVFVRVAALVLVLKAVVFPRGVLHHQAEVDPRVDQSIVPADEGGTVAAVNKAILVRWAPIDDLNLLDVDENASCHGRASLAVVLAGAEDGEHAGALAESDPFSMSFVRSYNIRVAGVLEEVVDGLRSKAYRAPATHARAEAVAVQVGFLLVARRIGPQAVGGNALRRSGLVRVRRGDTRDNRHHQDALHPGRTSRRTKRSR
mmetsp:Transcript_9158/g.34467  ORF Transcript_9158/g.34467 Transcript_9158/m.34467 type:complete len:235 (-) Transcript_9158:1456-2160(-)|eukprot:scaffold98_cov244-Pinguiococcus_pyrenoidosus.AAC.12